MTVHRLKITAIILVQHHLKPNDFGSFWSDLNYFRIGSVIGTIIVLFFNDAAGISPTAYDDRPKQNSMSLSLSSDILARTQTGHLKSSLRSVVLSFSTYFNTEFIFL